MFISNLISPKYLDRQYVRIFSLKKTSFQSLPLFFYKKKCCNYVFKLIEIEIIAYDHTN